MNELLNRILLKYRIHLLLFILLFISPLAHAQNYRFSVPVLKMNVFIQPDASAKIIYDISFRCASGAHPIDIVDIGMPHKNYDLGTMTAAIDGVSLSDIRHSEYVKPGVEIHLKNQAIKPGEEGTFHFECTMPRMVYQDTTRKDYASFRITPTWFGDRFITGTTEINIAVHTPPGINPDELLYQNREFTSKVLYEERAVALWKGYERLNAPYMVGISFPKREMDYVITQTAFDLLVKWFKENEEARWIAGLVFVLGFTVVFFRFTGNTGCSLFVILLAGLIYLFVVSPEAHLVAIPTLVVLAIFNEWLLTKRKKKYLPAIAEIEAGRIKRGLTAPEAAVLLELPLNKALTLLIFGMLKKGILRMVKDEPLSVEVVEDFRLGSKEGVIDVKERIEEMQKVARDKGTVVHGYEIPCIAAIQARHGKALSNVDFTFSMKQLIEHVVKRMKGFDPAITREYYKSIVSKAMQQARAIGEIPQKEKAIDKNLEWILIDENYPTVLSGRGYRYSPRWSRTILGSAKPSTTIDTSGGRTSFGDVAASFAGWSQNTMNNLASTISPGAIQIETAQKGVINLSGVDNVTSDVFEAIGEASRSGSGGGGGCACACAGCACACACAGGGR